MSPLEPLVGGALAERADGGFDGRTVGAPGPGPDFPVRPSALTVSHPPRSHPAGVLNLKSCELQHPEADRLVARALAGIDLREARSYPFQDAVSAALAERHGLPAGRILLTAGSDRAIGLLTDAFAVPAGRLLLPEPSFEAWRYYARLRGVPVTACPQVVGSPPRLDFGPLLAAVRTSPPAVVALTNPASPSGLLATEEEVLRLAEACDRYGHLLVIDECYGAFTGLTHLPLLSRFPRLVVVRSFSKSHALAGARVAAVFAREEITTHLAGYRPDSTVSGPALALLRQLLDQQEEFERVWADVRAIRTRFAEAVERARPHWRRLDPGANFVTFQTGSRTAPIETAETLLRHGYRVRALTEVPGLAECLRISLAGPAAMAEVAGIIAATAASAARSRVAPAPSPHPARSRSW
ncbi:Putative aminotransferase [Kitasatospora sp. MMS16-BH015]|uniref:pyridoxal phosphate-dependent aminotransferase n=1 Tax=Kitasatospora sp. MMS16-BH015 TaxID=2018025 RepID=UPI000CA0FF7A|nr:histidinol-phosphate transaminase [Kitasatospora sp. MMS16-BH015]AUG78266.1 Putative aminotransferase [Kitasatospora sp. MMS16-BH015]